MGLLIFQGQFAAAIPALAARPKIATVALAGIGGAVLGLSTLSFYGQPSEHLNNISTGFILGILAGTIYVLADSADSMSGGGGMGYSSLDKDPPEARGIIPETQDRVVHSSQSQEPTAPALAMSFQF